MPRPPSRHPTELELDILKILWRAGPLGVREVREALAPARSLAYTSVMTVMTIMARKGYVKRTKRGGRFIYRTAIGEQTVTRRMLGDLVDRVFDGSAVAAMLNLLETADVDANELKQLRALVNRKARGDAP